MANGKGDDCALNRRTHHADGDVTGVGEHRMAFVPPCKERRRAALVKEGIERNQRDTEHDYEGNALADEVT